MGMASLCLLLGSCKQDILEDLPTLPQNKEITSKISFDISSEMTEDAKATRSGYIDFNMEEKKLPLVTYASDFHTIGLLTSTKGRKAWFEFDFQKNYSKDKITLLAKSANLTLHWVDTRGMGTDITPSKDETWSLAGFTGGGEMKDGNVHFDDSRLSGKQQLTAQQKKVAMFSTWHPINNYGKNQFTGKMVFDMQGVCVKVSVEQHKNMNDYQELLTNHQYELQTNVFSPLGYFDLSKTSTTWTSNKPSWVNEKGKDQHYTYRYDGSRDNMITIDPRRDVFMVWGMPLQVGKEIKPQTIVYSTSKEVVTTRTGNDLVNQFWSHADLRKDELQGRIHFLDLNAKAFVTTPVVYYPIPLARFAERNISPTPGKWAESNFSRPGVSGGYTFRQVVDGRERELRKNLPDYPLYHVPTVEEWTAAIPLIEGKHKEGNTDYDHMNDIPNPIEYLETGKIKIPYRAQYRSLGKGKTMYGIRFIHTDREFPAKLRGYENIFRCAYRYDYYGTTWGNHEEARVRVWARYIGKDESITLDDIANEDYWNIRVPTDVIREFPFPGRDYTGKKNLETGYSAFYWTSSNGWINTQKWYIQFDDETQLKTSQQSWNTLNAVRPVHSTPYAPNIE